MNRCIPEPPDTSTTEETRSRLVINDDTDQSLSDIDNETVSDSDDSDYFPSPIGVPPSSSIRPKTAHTTGNHEASSKQSRHASLSLDQRSKSAKPHDFTRRKLSAAPAQRISQEDLDRLSKPVVHIPPPVVKSRPTPTSKLPPASPSNEHKRYSSVYPCANRLLAKRWDDAARKRHHDKLATMKTYIDSKPPQAQGHLKERAKKLHMEDQKLSKIERENHILLARMVRQMSVVQGFTGLDSDLKVKVTAARPTPSARKKKELLEQIDESNQILMQRVEARRPHYRQEIWSEERRTNLGYLQRITRFPEGYQHVLQREGVPPPRKSQLQVRMNRSETLRQKWAVESKSNLDEFGNPRRGSSPVKSSSSEEDGEMDCPYGPQTSKEIYLTKAEKLRREYNRFMKDGDEKNWRARHALYTRDPLDISVETAHTLNHPVVSSSSDDDGTGTHNSTGKRQEKIKVRMNRAQKLRLVEQEARMKEQEKVKVPIHLSNIEARIDFGQDSARLGKLNESTERDRELQFAMVNVDETDYEPMVTSEDLNELDDTRASWNQVFQGTALRTGFKLPDPYPVSVGVLWASSDEEDYSIERWEVLSRVLPRIKNRGQQFGMEVFLRDMKWGVPKTLADNHLQFDIAFNELETYLSDSVGIHFICFISNKRGSPATLPRFISITLFETILASIADVGGQQSANFIRKWYKIDENKRPPKYSLLPISAVIQDFLADIKTKAFRNAKEEWIATKNLLLHHMSFAAQSLIPSQEWQEDDAEVLRMLCCSKIEIEALKAIQGPTEDAILVLRDFAWQTEVTKDKIGPYLDWDADDKADNIAATQLRELRTTLLKWIPESNQIIDEVYFSPETGLKITDPDVKRYILGMTDSISELLENSLQRVSDRLTIDAVREEILLHSRIFSDSANSFTGKTRLVNKVLAFFLRRYRYGIPPFLVNGPLGNASTNLLCKGFQKFLDDAVPLVFANRISLTSDSPSFPISIVRFVGASPDSSNTVTLLKSICRQIKRAFTALLTPSQLTENPIYSSPVHDPDYLPGDFSSLSTYFLDLLGMASPERPIFLLLLNIDKLIIEDAGSSLAWLPIENSLSNVYIALSASHDNSAVIETIITKTGRAQQILSLTKKEIFGELILSLDFMDISNCQVELNRWLRQDNVSMAQHQRRSLLLAATSVSPSKFATTPWILRAHYLNVRRLRSWETYNPSIIHDVKDAEVHLVNQFFETAEKLHSKAMVSRFARLLLVVRDGLSESALEDLLSLDAEILADSIASQIECSFITPLTPLIPIPRVPSVAIVYLLNTLVKDFELVLRGRGYEKGPNLLKWTHDLVKDVAKARYLADAKIVQSTFEDIASYFNNDWTDPAKGLKMQRPEDSISVYLKGIGSHGENWKGILKPYRLLPKHVNSWIIDEEVSHNLRRLRVLPRALMFAQRYRDVRKLFEDFEFLEALLDASGIQGILKELVWLIKEGRKQSPAMPSDCVLTLKHLILFFRLRALWISQFDSIKFMKPPGLWLQEFNNFPQNSSAAFVEPIRAFIEDNVDHVFANRGGRIEYDTTWTPENEAYEPIPFHHSNVQCCAVSIDGKFMASGASDGTVKVWNACTGEEIMSFCHIIQNDSASSAEKPTKNSCILNPNKNGVTFVSFSAERQPTYVVSCAHDIDQEPNIKLWNLKNLNLPPKVMAGGHEVGASIIRCEYLPPENRRLMSVGSDFNVVLWEVARCKIIRTFTAAMIDFDFSIGLGNGTQSKVGTANQLAFSRRRRMHKSGYPQIAAAVSQTGLFAYGSTTLAIYDDHWREVLTREVNVNIDKDRSIKWHRITSIAFNSDSSLVFAASAVLPDDVQLMSVERQQVIEKMAAINDNELTVSPTLLTAMSGSQNPLLTSNANVAAKADTEKPTFNASAYNSASVKTEVDIKRAKQTVIRAWNIETGHLKIVFYVEDYINSMVFTYNNNYLLTSGSKGTIIGWCPLKGTQEFTRDGHVSGIAQIVSLPPVPRRRRDEEDALFYTYNGSFNMSLSRSLSSLSGNTPSPIQFLSLGLDNKILLWTLDHENVFPGMNPISHCAINLNSDYMVTVGGAVGNVSLSGRNSSLIRLWEVATGTIRVKFEVPAEVIYVTFISGDELRILMGCKSGLVRLYKVKSAELIHEFWVDSETAMSESTLGYHMDWPFAVTGVSAVAYALHPQGKYLAVAVGGHQRTATPANTLTNAKIDHMADAASIKETRKPVNRVTSKDDVERSSDKVLRDIIKLTFWDTNGNCIIYMDTFNFKIFADVSDVSCVTGPIFLRPSLHRKMSFALSWSGDGKCLFASDDCEIFKEGALEFRANHVYDTMHIKNYWRRGQAPSFTRGLGIIDIDEFTPNLEVSSATALSSIVYKRIEHTCFAYGDGIIGLMSRDLDRFTEDIRWFLAHRGCGRTGGDIVSCAFIPGIEGRTSMNFVRGRDSLIGVIVSARRDGTIVIQDTSSKEVCAVFGAGSPITVMNVVPSSFKPQSSLKIVICKADGAVALLRYYSS